MKKDGAPRGYDIEGILDTPGANRRPCCEV